MIRWLQRQLDKLRPSPFRALQCSGNWYVRYPDGARTHWLDYNSASNLAAIYGGRVIHRSEDTP